MNRRLSNEQASGKTNTHLWSLHIIWFFLIHALNKKLYNRGIYKFTMWHLIRSGLSLVHVVVQICYSLLLIWNVSGTRSVAISFARLEVLRNSGDGLYTKQQTDYVLSPFFSFFSTYMRWNVTIKTNNIKI